MGICAACTSAIQNIHYHRWPRQDVRFETRLQRYRDATRTECWICRGLSEWLESNEPHTLEIWRETSLEVVHRVAADLDFEDPSYAMYSTWMEVLPREYENDGDYIGHYFQFKLHFMASEEYVESRDSLVRTKPPASGCHDGRGVNFELIRTWFDRCTKEHPNCSRGMTTPPWYPTRLLSLGSHDDDVRLIVPHDEPPDGPYMSLSHRWGFQEYTKLTSGTMTRLQSGVDVKSLPQAFQDTMRIARFLGIRYLWIDALCIKQGLADTADWDVESATMDRVYSSAILNVSATLSRNGTESLFSQSPQERYRSEINLRSSPDHPPTKYHIFHDKLWSEEIDNGPLNRRGWVFQERLLSQRVLHFTARYLGWECPEMDALSTLPDGLPPSYELSSRVKSTLLKMSPVAQDPGLIQKSQTMDFARYWHRLVRKYSETELTFPRDKMVALMGVAKTVMRIRRGRYAYGAWEETLLYNLTWFSPSSACQKAPGTDAQAPCRVPSWSWASSEEHVLFSDPVMPTLETFASELYFVDNANPSDGSSSNSEPEVIHVRGMLLPITVIHFVSGHITSFSVLGLHFAPSSDSRALEVHLPHDEVQELIRGGTLLILPLLTNTLFFVTAVLLAPAKGVDAYRRVGLVWFRPSLYRDTHGSEGVSKAGKGKGAVSLSGAEQERNTGEKDGSMGEDAGGKEAEKKRARLENYASAMGLLEHCRENLGSAKSLYII